MLVLPGVCVVFSYLDYHSQSNRDENLLGVIKRLKASKQRTTSNATLGRRLFV